VRDEITVSRLWLKVRLRVQKIGSNCLMDKSKFIALNQTGFIGDDLVPILRQE